MSERVPYGFECANPKCKTGIIMGEMFVRPTRGGELGTFVTVKTGKLKCPRCGWEQEYTQADLREFPATK